ncbi:MAG: nitrogenase [Gracilibacter sp. BRH_c7a]|nr:MAG: nitrogenase [Gracilibacter sp. BRH_c7a]
MKKDKTGYRNVSENPCNMCMPLGGILALKGIEGSMVLLHGSQGCATYMRRTISEHYNEPIDVASTSLNEKGTVFGGEDNFKKGLDNIRLVYQPEIIGVLTTCLAETIGEDIERMAKEYIKDREIEGFPIISAPTPGYAGTQAEGYFSTLRKIIMGLAKETKKNKKINVIVPHISTADLREIKRILASMDIEAILLPDYSDTLDAPYTKTYERIVSGGTKVQDIASMSGSQATIEMAEAIDDVISPGAFLKQEYGVPLYRIPLPVGLKNTDIFINTLKQITGSVIPLDLSAERGRLLDGMIDSHKHNFQGIAAIFGEPEHVLSAVTLCMENGIFPQVIATGSKTHRLEDLLYESLAESEQDYHIMNDTDFSHIREKCKNSGVNIAIGHSEGKYLTEKEGIPLVRYGFPIHDRIGGQRLLSVGYTGSLSFLDRITNTLLDHKYINYRSTMLQKYYDTRS